MTTRRCSGVYSLSAVQAALLNYHNVEVARFTRIATRLGSRRQT